MNKIMSVRSSSFGLAMSGLITIGGCGKNAAPPPAAGFAVPVTAMTAQSQDVPVSIDEIGHITASEVVTIQPQVSGMVLTRRFQDGADIKKGDLLFEIDPRPFQAALDQAEGQLAKDKAQETSSEWNVGQDTEALATKAISQQQLHNDTAARDQAKASMKADQAAIDYATLNVKYCQIRSPIDGRAGARLVDAGNVVTAAGQAPGTNLLSIQKVDPIYADFTVDEGQLGMVRKYMSDGQLQTQVSLPEDMAQATGLNPVAAPTTGPLTGPTTAPATAPSRSPESAMSSAPRGPRVGKLIFLDNAVQDGGGTVKLRAELANSDLHFWPGQFVNVKLVLTVQKGAVLVPRRSTQLSQTGPFIYTIDDKSSCHIEPIKLGQIIGDMIVVNAGLNAGQQVVVTGQQLLQDGAPVSIASAQQGGQK